MKRWRTTGRGLLVLAALLALEWLLLMLGSLRGIDALRSPLWDNADFTWLLIRSNPWQGLLALFNQPLLIVGSLDPVSGDFYSALFYYPGGTLLHLLLAWLVARYLGQARRVGGKGFVLGVLLALVASNQLWLAACCGQTPGWLLDTALRLYVFASDGETLHRLKLYEGVLPFLDPLRWIVAAAGFGLVWRRVPGSR